MTPPTHTHTTSVPHARSQIAPRAAFSQPAITAAALAGKFCISAAFGLLWVLPAEMYPAHCLGAALGFANVCGRSGSMLAPVATAALPLWGTAAACCAVSLAGAAALAAID